MRSTPRYAAAFSSLWQQAAAGDLSSWEASDDGALALIIVLDQFPRNMFRGDARTYASDALAREVARRAIDRGADARIDPALLEFLYMPFMHSEHLPDQLRCVELFRDAGNAENLKYARGPRRHHPPVRPLPPSQPHAGPRDHAGRAGLSGRRRVFRLMTEQ